MITKRRYLIIAVVVAVFVALLSINSGVGAYAIVSDVDFELSEFEVVGSKQYYNATEGCEYRVYVAGNAFESLSRVTYQQVKLHSVADTVEVDDSNNIKLTAGQTILTENEVVVDKFEFEKKDNSDKYYFTVSTHVNCAFVFTVYYFNHENEEIAVYGTKFGQNGENRTNVLYCKIIDASAPVAYAEFDCCVSGMWNFAVTIKGNKNSDIDSVDSGIKSFAILKSANTVRDDNDFIIFEEKNINKFLYVYTLSVSGETATYFIDIVDHAGNLTTSKLQEFSGSQDPDVEYTKINYLNELKSEAYSDFSPSVAENLENAYNKYYVALQNSDASKDRLALLRQECLNIFAQINKYKTLKENNLADLTVKNYNTDYFGGKIEVKNSAVLPILYGEGGTMTLAVAQHEFSSVPNDVKSVADIKNAKNAFAVTVETMVKGEELTVARDNLQLFIPREFDIKNSVFVMKSEIDGNAVVSKCRYTVQNGGTVVYIPCSSGTLFVFEDTATTDLTWLWSLCAIPVLVGVVVAVLLVKKNKKSKVEEK